MSEHWKEPRGGPYQVAISARLYESRQAEVDGFLGRPLSKYSHDFTHGQATYTVFRFPLRTEAEAFMRAFGGEPFDPRDIGGGSKWMIWYKGRAAARKRSPYDFS